MIRALRTFLLPMANLVVWFVACVLAYARWVEPNWIQVEKVSFEVPTVNDRGEILRIVHLSDLHVSHLGSREKSLIRHVNALKPDLVLVTGDIAQYWGWTGSSVKVLDGLEAQKGTFVTLGDADYSNRQGHCSYCHGSSGSGKSRFRILRNSIREAEIRGNRVVVGGVDDPSGPEAHEIPILSAQKKEANLKILLLSSPVDYQAASEAGYDLVLTGDTHGGQVRIGGVLFRSSEEEGDFDGIRGWVRGRGVPLYINRGIGTNVLSFRLGSRPEITVFEVRQQNSSK